MRQFSRLRSPFPPIPILVCVFPIVRLVHQAPESPPRPGAPVSTIRASLRRVGSPTPYRRQDISIIYNIRQSLYMHCFCHCLAFLGRRALGSTVRLSDPSIVLSINIPEVLVHTKASSQRCVRTRFRHSPRTISVVTTCRSFHLKSLIYYIRYRQRGWRSAAVVFRTSIEVS